MSLKTHTKIHEWKYYITVNDFLFLIVAPVSQICCFFLLRSPSAISKLSLLFRMRLRRRNVSRFGSRAPRNLSLERLRRSQNCLSNRRKSVSQKVGKSGNKKNYNGKAWITRGRTGITLSTSEEHVARFWEFLSCQNGGRSYGSPLCFSNSIMIIFKLCKKSRWTFLWVSRKLSSKLRRGDGFL